MQKYTIKKTYIYGNKFIYNIFGLDGENNDYIITNDNIDYLREYVENYIEEFGENEDLKKYLSLIEKELEEVDEVQVVRE